MKKNNLKKLLSVVTTAALALTMGAGLMGCTSTAGSTTGSTAATSSTASQSTGTSAAKKNVTVGVIQYATHPSLDNCYTGFVQGLADGGYVEGENLTIDFQNAAADSSSNDLMAKNMISSQYDMVMGIATPSAMALYADARDTDIPVIFTAVSDPVGAGVVESLDAPGVNCTGSSDVLDLAAQLELIRAFLPNADTIGVVYTTSEVNSVTQLKELQEIAPDYGFEIKAVGVTQASEVATAAQSLVSEGVDCFNNFTDNLVVENLGQLLNAANEANIPVFGSEQEQVKNGCLACQGIDYTALGYKTGLMAAAILDGDKTAAETPVYTTSEYSPFYNSKVAATLGLELPKDYTTATDVAG
jgi:putative ABC transport system substrate-binding protein